MTKSQLPAITDLESLRSALRDYAALHSQINEHAKKTKPVSKRMNQIKKCLLDHMISDNLVKVQLPNKDLLVVQELARRPSMSEKYIRSRLGSFYKDDTSQASELMDFLMAVPEDELKTRTILRHLSSDSYIENESELGQENENI
jgi:Family of unknown function (DUF5760)